MKTYLEMCTEAVERRMVEIKPIRGTDRYVVTVPVRNMESMRVQIAEFGPVGTLGSKANIEALKYATQFAELEAEDAQMKTYTTAAFSKRLVSALRAWNTFNKDQRLLAIAEADKLFDNSMCTGTLESSLLRMRDDLIEVNAVEDARGELERDRRG